MSKELTPRKANKLALEMQVVLVKALEIALRYTFNGRSMLWGKEVASSDLAAAKNRMWELDRHQQIHVSGKYKELPYLPSNGSATAPNTEKLAAHLTTTGQIKFLEATDSTRSGSVKRHVGTKQLLKKRIQQSLKKTAAADKTQNKMATTKNKAAKKTATKVSNKKAGTATAQDMRDAYDKAPKTFNIAEWATANGVAYGRVYGAIMKHTDGKLGSVVKKAAAPKKEKATA